MRPKIFLFGDSITEESFSVGGWGASLANHFARTVDVVLRGYSGYNTRWALKVMDRVFQTEEDDGAPLAVTVFFGANDAALPDRCSGFQHVPLHEYKQNLHSIVSFFKGEILMCFSLRDERYKVWDLQSSESCLVRPHPSHYVRISHFEKRWPTTHVILITPPPIDEDGRLRCPYVENPLGLPERTNENAGDYAKACVIVAGECGIPVVDLWTEMQECPGWRKDYLSDGLHLTPSGNGVVFEEVIGKLKDEGLSPEALPADLPLLVDIDPNDPLKSF